MIAFGLSLRYHHQQDDPEEGGCLLLEEMKILDDYLRLNRKEMK